MKDEIKLLPFTYLKKEDFEKMNNKEKREFEKQNCFDVLPKEE